MSNSGKTQHWGNLGTNQILQSNTGNTWNQYNPTYVGGVDTAMPSMIPVVMKIASQTIGMDLVSVQPMTGPSGHLFYMNYGNGKETMEEKSIRIRKERKEKYEKIFGK